MTVPFFTQSQSTMEIIKLIRKILPETIIVVGGSYPSSLGTKFMDNNPSVDVLVIGEGEVTLKKLCDSEFKNLHSVAGIIYRDEANIVRQTHPHSLIHDLDSMPFADRSHIPYKALSKLVIGPFFRRINVDLSRIKAGRVNR